MIYDYYPGVYTERSRSGMVMGGRNFSSNSYRYGFGGKEKDDELKGAGNSYDFGARIYDSRLGRWLAVDPYSNKFADWSPYVFAFNNPLFFTDSEGEAPQHFQFLTSSGLEIYAFAKSKGMSPYGAVFLIAQAATESSWGSLLEQV